MDNDENLTIAKFKVGDADAIIRLQQSQQFPNHVSVEITFKGREWDIGLWDFNADSDELVIHCASVEGRPNTLAAQGDGDDGFILKPATVYKNPRDPGYAAVRGLMDAGITDERELNDAFVTACKMAGVEL